MSKAAEHFAPSISQRITKKRKTQGLMRGRRRSFKSIESDSCATTAISVKSQIRETMLLTRSACFTTRIVPRARTAFGTDNVRAASIVIGKVTGLKSTIIINMDAKYGKSSQEQPTLARFLFPVKNLHIYPQVLKLYKQKDGADVLNVVLQRDVSIDQWM